MKKPFISRAPRLGCEHGVTMVLVAIAMVAIIAMAAISIDVITLYLAREEAQRSADTAALAAARVISLSGVTGDPNNSNPTSTWKAICGGSSTPASLAASTIALQNVVGGASANTVTVTYSAPGGGSGSQDCSTLVSSSPSAFSTNPTVTVQVQRTNLPNFFSRIWSRSGTNISASATAEVFNSSYSGSVGTAGTIVPVQPTCVKPWFVPNHDPLNPTPAQNGGIWCDNKNGQGQTIPCNSLVSATTGSITNPGISLSGTNATGVIGESFYLSPDCSHVGTGCNPAPRAVPIHANLTGNGYVPGPQNGDYNLLFYPGQAPTTIPAALPSCSSGGNLYEQAVAGCDQSTVYQCGIQLANTIDMSENPATQNGDVTTGVQCLIHQGRTNGAQPDGQDFLNDSIFPFQVQAGTSNPLVLSGGLTSGNPVSASNSIVSLPIYDDSAVSVSASGTTTVTVIGFVQVFISQVDDYDAMNVTVLNVTGCGNGNGAPVGPNPIAGTSPVPIRLITPP